MRQTSARKRCRARPRGRMAGFSLLELAVTITIMALLTGTILQRVQKSATEDGVAGGGYREQAEMAAMAQVAAALRSSLTLKAGSLQTKGRGREIADLARRNPMDWLAQRPPNYLGEYYAPKPSDIAAGNWYFDKQALLLVYVMDNARTADGQPRQHDFKVELIAAQPNNPLEIEGVVLRELLR